MADWVEFSQENQAIYYALAVDYLEPFKNAKAAWQKPFTDVVEATTDNKVQQQRLDELHPLIEAKFKELQQTIDLRTADKGKAGLEDALKVVTGGTGKKSMDDIRRLIAAMKDNEHGLLIQRDAEAKTTRPDRLLVHRRGGGDRFPGGDCDRRLRGAFRHQAGRFRDPAADDGQLGDPGDDDAAGVGGAEQAAAVTETVATVDEVTQTAEQATQRARALGDAVQRRFRWGRRAGKVTEDSIAALSKVQEQVETTAQNILALAEQAQTIGEITAAVADVAEQTNLLALNAAIEASRAGEHGKGFAVVASEVKALADQSKKATGQVRQILGEIQKGTNAAVLSTEEVTKGVASAGRVADQAGQTIKALADTLAEAAQAAAQITASAGQQATGMAQIHQAMRNIDEAARQNLAALRQAEQAARNLNTLGGQFTQFIGKRKTFAEPVLTRDRLLPFHELRRIRTGSANVYEKRGIMAWTRTSSSSG